MPHLDPDAQGIDFGCGSGVLGIALRALGLRRPLDGIDLSPVMLEMARNTGCYRHLKRGNLLLPEVGADLPGPYAAFTVAHLFGEVWTRSALDTRDRRLMTIGVLAALGQSNLIEIQFQSALERGELTDEQVRETVAHLAHYIGWPLSTGVNEVAERAIARRNRSEASS